MTSHPTYNQQTITQYLLGALPAVETERLDALSFTDNEFSDLLGAVEKDLVDAYVQGELAGDELEQFKAFYLVSPLRREKVEFAQAFQGWSKKNATEQAERVKVESRETHKAAGSFFGPRVFRLTRPTWQWGFAAAAVVLLIAGGLLVFQNLRLRQQMTQTQARHDELLQREQELKKQIEAQRSANSQREQELAQLRAERERLEQELKKAEQESTKPSSGEGNIVSLILAPPLRGAGQAPTVSIKPGTIQVAAQLQLEAADYSAYRVLLIDPAKSQTLWSVGGLKARTRGDRSSLAVSLPAGLLKPQNYILRVTGVSAGHESEIVGDYSFRVVK